jgi:hypothetical protein
MTAEQRSVLALRMSDDVRQIAAEGIKQRPPGDSDQDVRRALVALLHGPDLAAKVWPGLPVPSPRAAAAEKFLARIVGALDQAAVPYMLAGSFASSRHLPGLPFPQGRRSGRVVDPPPRLAALRARWHLRDQVHRVQEVAMSARGRTWRSRIEAVPPRS